MKQIIWKGKVKMYDYRFTIKGLNCVCENSSLLVLDNADYSASFDFDANWDDSAVKSAVFVTDEGVRHTVLLENDRCTIPKFISGTGLYVGVVSGGRKTTRPAFIGMSPSVRSLPGSDEEEPDETLYEQIMALLNETMSVAQVAQTAVESARNTVENAKTDAENACDIAVRAKNTVNTLASDTVTARNRAESAADRAEMAAAQNGYFFVEDGDDGCLYFVKSDNVNIDFEDDDGDLVIIYE